MEAADDEGNATINKRFKEFIFWAITEIVNSNSYRADGY